MATSRYTNTPVIDFGSQYGTSTAIASIRKAIANNQVSYKEIIVRGSERLDTIAGVLYGDARYWWILAAASNIGWGLQVKPGTVLKVIDLADALSLVL